METALYLIPVGLGNEDLTQVLPKYNKEIILHLKHFVVEDLRSARRFLKQIDKQINLDTLCFYEIGKHTDETCYATYLEPLKNKESIGVLSEAGCPAIADPGAVLVAIAQRKGFKVVPLVGPSSILLSLMASGFNGQNFAFLGYLPIDDGERVKVLQRIEKRMLTEHQTQIFIETPYRNKRIIQQLLKTLSPQTLLCIAAGITTEKEYIQTKSVKEWKAKGVPEIDKTPAIFLIYHT